MRKSEMRFNKHIKWPDQFQQRPGSSPSPEILNVRTVNIGHVNLLESKKGHFDLKFGLPTKKTKEINTMVEITLTNEQKVEAKIAPKSATGKPAKLDGIPTWTIQSGDSDVVVSEDGLSATLISDDAPGDTVVLIEADAKEGPEVQTISDIITIHVSGALAENLGLEVGTPIAK